MKLHADGRFAEKLAVIGPAHKRKPRVDLSVAPPESAFIYPVMEGRMVFKHAVESMPLESGVKTSSAPKARSSVRRSSLIVSGIVRMHR